MSTKKLKKQQTDFLKVLESRMGNVSESCNQFDIPRNTYYRWMKNEVFANAVEEVKEGLIDFTESALYKQIKEGNPTCIIFYLKTKGRKRGYIEKKEHEVNHTGSINLIVELTDEPEGIN